MGLTRYKLGELIQQRREKYDEMEKLPIRGVTREGFISPKQEEADLSIYNVFYKNDFVFNPARMELNSIAYNTVLEKGICSSLYEVFYVVRDDLLFPEYLNLYIKRDEFARRCWFEAVGSARNYFRMPSLSEFIIELPSLLIQQKYVEIYKAMVSNQQSYERGLEDLKLVCDGFIEDLRRELPSEKIGDYLIWSDQHNDCGLSVDAVRGLSTGKEMILTKADMDGVELENYKIVRPGQIAYVSDTSRRGDKVSLGFNNTESTYLVSSISTVFGTKKEMLVPEYLMLFLNRSEFDRYARFNSWGSARENFSFEDMSNISIPVPDIEVQKAIAKVYSSYTMRKRINEQLKQQIKDIYPILIKGSLEEGKKA